MEYEKLKLKEFGTCYFPTPSLYSIDKMAQACCNCSSNDFSFPIHRMLDCSCTNKIRNFAEFRNSVTSLHLTNTRHSLSPNTQWTFKLTEHEGQWMHPYAQVHSMVRPGQQVKSIPEVLPVHNSNQSPIIGKLRLFALQSPPPLSWFTIYCAWICTRETWKVRD